MNTAVAITPIQAEDYLYLVDRAINIYIRPRMDIADMEYADLYQTGCLALCHAAASYQPDRNACFATYASTVIRNRLYDYCRHVNCIHSRLLYLDAPMNNDGNETFAEQLPAPSESPQELVPLLQEIRKEYRGVAAKGIDVLLLKADGYSCKDIANMYQVKPNHVSAWMSRASSRLRKDPRVLAIAQ